uniref:Secreted protein n=1 Tax=Ixodes ricinus TaxID=34613 RepID=A0A6B0TYP6_IXORI
MLRLWTFLHGTHLCLVFGRIGHAPAVFQRPDQWHDPSSEGHKSKKLLQMKPRSFPFRRFSQRLRLKDRMTIEI